MSRPKQADRIAALENAVSTLVNLISANQAMLTPAAIPAPVNATPKATPKATIAHKIPTAKLNDAAFVGLMDAMTTKGLYWTAKNGCHAVLTYNYSTGFVRFCRPENAKGDVIICRTLSPGNTMDASRVQNNVPGLSVWQYRAKVAR